MPVVRKPLTPVSDKYRRLVQRLADELLQGSQPGPDTDPAAPAITEEEQRGNYLRVAVIWDEWTDQTPEDRGRVIMDAYEKVRPSDVLRITIALGLTHTEAQRLGVGALSG